MNMHAHMSGQISGQVPNQSGTQLPGLPQQNGSSLSNQIQNLGAHLSTLNLDLEFTKVRRFMQEKIYEFLMQRYRQAQNIPLKRVLDIVRRLDEGLCRIPGTKEEYMNLDTLESRLHILIKRLPMSNQNQQYPHLSNTAFPVVSMIPTPGMQHNVNSSVIVTSSADTSIIAAGSGNTLTPTSGSLLPTTDGPSIGMHGGSLTTSDGEEGRAEPDPELTTPGLQS